MKNQLESLEKYYSECEQHAKKEIMDIINSTIENDCYIKRLGELAKEFKIKRMNDFFLELSIEIKTKMHLIHEKIQTKLRIENEDIKGALEDFNVVFKYKESVSAYITESITIYESINTTLNTLFISYTEKVAILEKITTDVQVRLAEKACENIFIFYMFNYTFEGKKQVLLYETSSQKAKKAFDEAQKYLKENVNNFRSAISEMNPSELRKTLNNSQK